MKKNLPTVLAVIIAIIIIGGAYVYKLGKTDNNSGQNNDQAINNGLGLENVPIKGNKDAPITILEFGDFQCVACVQFFATMDKEIQSKFIDTNKAKMAFKTLAFIDNYAGTQSKKESLLSSKASACANDQGKFWEMHDKIYEAELQELIDKKEQENSGNLTENFFKDSAQRIGLNKEQFESCLASDKYSKEADRLMNDAEIAMNGRVSTPTVFIIKDGKGTQITKPFDISLYELIIK